MFPTVIEITKHVAPFNAAGLPCTAQPVPTQRRLPASLQLVGPMNGEEVLVTTAETVERATPRTTG
jgi:Asp-tRNA(Asn)/Glu-tRNA(Gln) amidotransferase A subunit family amidase